MRSCNLAWHLRLSLRTWTSSAFSVFSSSLEVFIPALARMRASSSLTDSIESATRLCCDLRYVATCWSSQVVFVIYIFCVLKIIWFKILIIGLVHMKYFKKYIIKTLTNVDYLNINIDQNKIILKFIVEKSNVGKR